MRENVLAQLVQTLRVLETVRGRLGLHEVTPHVDASRKARAAIAVADIAASGLDPKRMRAYGELTGSDTEQLQQLCASLRAEFRRLHDAMAAKERGTGERP